MNYVKKMCILRQARQGFSGDGKALSGLIKIGKTKEFQSRMRQLEENGYRNVTGLKREFAIELENYEEIEMLLDDLFAKSRVGNTELFSLDKNKIIQLLSSFSGTQVYPTQETKQEVFERATEVVQSQLIPDGEYKMSKTTKDKSVSLKAVMIVENGRFILKKGSQIATMQKEIPAGWALTRATMKISSDGVLLEDVECSSPSMASAVVIGRRDNGWTSWKNKQNQYIDVYRQVAFDEE